MPMQTVLVTTVPVADDVTLAAWWDCGREIRVHRDAGGAVSVVGRWAIWNQDRECPLIEPTRESFERFVRRHLQEPGILDQRLAAA